MTLLNPTARRAPLDAASRSANSHPLSGPLRRLHGSLEELIGFVRTEHLSTEMLHAFWRREERAVMTVRTLSQRTGFDLAAIAQEVASLLERTRELPLVTFQGDEAATLFELIDGIDPERDEVGDGRQAAEIFHYAAEARTALLHHTLLVLNGRYPPSSFANLIEATLWTQAFAALIQDADQIIRGTQSLLADEATALQSHLDTLRHRLELAEAQERTPAPLRRAEWRALLAEAEEALLSQLALRSQRLSELTFGELREAREGGWLPVLARRAPILGTLLVTLASGGALLQPGVQSGVRGSSERLAEGLRSFPVLARHALLPNSEQAPNDTVAHFFRSAERPRGRQTLTIADGATLQRVLDELARFGYARREVLALFGLGSVNELSSALTLEVRWSQGGRPLLLPPYDAPSVGAARPLADYTVQLGASLPSIAHAFGLTVEQLAAANGLAGEPTAAQSILLPAQGWAQQARAPGTLAWGSSLAQVARTLSLAPEALADLNDIANPDSWLYEGQALRLPALPAAVAPAAPVAARLGTTPARYDLQATPLVSMVVYRVQGAETLAHLAERHHTTIAELMADNRLQSQALAPGQTLLVRTLGRVIAVAPATSEGGIVLSQGSFGGSRVPAALAPAPPSAAQGDAIVQRYGSQLFPSVEAMPDEARRYFTGTVQEVADFFNVRPGDIIGILQAENNNAGLRLAQPAVSSAGARGVAQVVARTWSGWANPNTSAFASNMVEIEQYGGLGFDWSAREQWRAWSQGQGDASSLTDSHADPTRFEDSVAAVARHLAHWELTRDRAASDPAAFRQRLGDAISVYNSGRPLAEAASFRQSAANAKTTAQYVADAIAVADATPSNIALPVAPAQPVAPLREGYRALMERSFGVALSETELARALSGSAVEGEVAAGRLSVAAGAEQLFRDTLQHFVTEGRAAQAVGQPLPWPFVYDEATLGAQQLAVFYLGRPLSQWEIEGLLAQSGGARDALAAQLAARGDARLFAATRQALGEALGRPVATAEVVALVQPAVAGYNAATMSEGDLQRVRSEIQGRIHALPELRAQHGITAFAVPPLQPMPRLIRAFGAPVDYQRGGLHTGIDVAGPRVNGQEPLLYAVATGTVAYVGPLYCDASDACRGGRAIVLDHGNHVYSIYSHNSAALVVVGQSVQAGQEIGRQGDEGYSFGSHLHFEVHTGAPFSGDWQEPFAGGHFEDPLAWLPGAR